MICDCGKTVHTKFHIKLGQWACEYCYPQTESKGSAFPHFVETVNLKHYYKNGGNVSKKRIEMVRSRRMHPEGKGEVILTRNGKITENRSINY